MSNAALGAIRRYSRTTAARVTIDWYVHVFHLKSIVAAHMKCRTKCFVLLAIIARSEC